MKVINFRNELENLPKGIILGKSNAFPWVTMSGKTEYLSFRSAPSHFPNNNSRIIILKRKIGTQKWTLEHEFGLNKDLREPRIVTLKSKLLFLYFCALKRFAIFKPESIMLSEKLDKYWSAPKETYKTGFMVYSVKEINNILYMTCYNKKYASECYFLKSTNGREWKDVFPDKHIEKYLTCETDFVVKDGYYYLVSRNEFGKFDKYGSEIFKFDKEGNLIKHSHNNQKFDGPFLFENDGEIFLIARKNMENRGNFLLPIKPVKFFGYWISNLYYWLTPKKTAIWKLDKESLETEFMIKLPSNGDTSYASALHHKGKTKIYYYSSPLSPIKSWLAGQMEKTSIYSVEVIF